MFGSFMISRPTLSCGHWFTQNVHILAIVHIHNDTTFSSLIVVETRLTASEENIQGKKNKMHHQGCVFSFKDNMGLVLKHFI